MTKFAMFAQTSRFSIKPNCDGIHARMKKIIVPLATFIFLVLSIHPLSAQSLTERSAKKSFAKERRGRVDVRTRDDGKVDVLTRKHAVEVEKARHWDKAIEKSLQNSRATKKKAGIVIIKNGRPLDDAYARRLRREIKKKDLDIDVWEMEPEED